MRNVSEFINRWNNCGDERSDTQLFWLQLLRDVLDIERPDELIEFEKRVDIEHVSFIDAYISSTRTLIEQKSYGVNLDRATPQSDGQLLTPYQQARRYSNFLPDSQRARWIVTCNFQEFRIYDMEKPKAEPEIILLQSLNTQWHKLAFLVDVNSASPKSIREVELSVKAGKLVGKLYDSLLERYINPDDKNSQISLNIFCVRIVFLLYAEDAGLFGKNQFHNYLKARELVARNALRDLFGVLSQKYNERDPYLEADLKTFPYVNGGLFADNDIELPQLDGEPLRIILEEMSEGFDWSGISPTIFGAVFESTLNPETRHSGGMHYTSIENIHKVIDPLFLDNLNEEFNAIIKAPESRRRTQKLRTFQKKLASLKFFDPACGSGNFLTESYLSLRRLENKILSALSNQISFTESESDSAIQVSISQFYGIEINDFAVSVARTALWIAEAQMWNETRNIIHFYGDLLPLKTYDNIHEANALKIDWAEVVKPHKLNFIMGNPPFRGARVMNQDQKKELNEVFTNWKNAGNLDYVSCWYKKAADFMRDTDIKAALVSTNSITQGDSVATLWKPLFEDGIRINFAWRTFKWDSEAADKAHVHCVIVAFSYGKNSGGVIFDGEEKIEAQNINAYLIDAPDIFIEARSKALCNVPAISNGSKPLDNAICAFTPEEKFDFIKRELGSKAYFYRYMGGYEFINGVERYFLLINRIPPHELRHMPSVLNLLKQIRDYRLSSDSAITKKLADTPSKFHFENMPDKDYLVIPQTSSSKRKYIPIGFLSPDVLVNNKLQIMRDGGLYELGILSSNIHNAWVRMVAGRLRNDFTYSISVVYNNFVWPSPSEKQRSKIEFTAQRILDARNLYPESSLADLYDPLKMPEELLKAHKANDAAVCEAYGWSKDISDTEIVARLFSLYIELIA